ncbi:MAG: glycosyltransferase family 4 protein [Gammaproteobacteria bacterium]
MKLAFCIFKYFPFGGLQRDFIQAVSHAHAKGHDVDVYTMSWEGEKPSGINIHIIPKKGISNHTRALRFAQVFEKIKHDVSYDCAIGFNKMPGIDIYFAGDRCFKDWMIEHHPRMARLLPRYRHYLSLENAVFKTNSKSQIILINPKDKATFQKYYGTADKRFSLIPPGIEPRLTSVTSPEKTRNEYRKQFAIPEDAFWILFVNSNFKLKGADRLIHAIAQLPPQTQRKIHCTLIGDASPDEYIKLIKSLKASHMISTLGPREDVGEFLVSADLLAHPARQEVGGKILIEALSANLPVLVTENCGYASVIKEAKSGLTVPSPFNQKIFNAMLNDILTADRLKEYRYNAAHFPNKEKFYCLADNILNIIEANKK